MQVFAATSLAAVGVLQEVSLERLVLQGAVRVTWSPPTDLCGLTNPQYTIEYGRTTSTPTTHPMQHTFLLTIGHHRPRSRAGVLYKGSCSWKWYLQQLGASDTLQRCKSTAPACVTVYSNTEYTEYICKTYLHVFSLC